MKSQDKNSDEISANLDEDIKQILANTNEIKREVVKKEKELKIVEQEVEDKEEKRKEQLREAQKRFKKIGCSVNENVADKFEDLAHKLNYATTSAMCRAYLMLLLESKEFQDKFVEIKTVISTND